MKMSSLKNSHRCILPAEINHYSQRHMRIHSLQIPSVHERSNENPNEIIIHCQTKYFDIIRTIYFPSDIVTGNRGHNGPLDPLAFLVRGIDKAGQLPRGMIGKKSHVKSMWLPESHQDLTFVYNQDLCWALSHEFHLPRLSCIYIEYFAGLAEMKFPFDSFLIFTRPRLMHTLIFSSAMNNKIHSLS